MRKGCLGSVIGIIAVVVVAVVALVVIAQLVPYGRNHTNAAVVKEPAWPNPETRALAKRACFDCHSNEVTWPWYSNIAPVSWLVARDVNEGRQRLNFSEWGMQRRGGEGEEGEGREGGEGGEGGEDMVETVRNGEMPPAIYLIMHPNARLTDAEKQQLIEGLSQIR